MIDILVLARIYFSDNILVSSNSSLRTLMKLETISIQYSSLQGRDLEKHENTVKNTKND